MARQNPKEQKALQWRKPGARYIAKKRAHGGTPCLKWCHVALESTSMVKEGHCTCLIGTMATKGGMK